MTSLDRWLEWILVIVMIGATLAFGGVQPIAYSLMEVVLFVAVLLLIIKQTRQGKLRLHLPLWPLLFALWVLLQVMPLP
jgi:uncharacterized membrane protein YtjA (UPF0391 family)